MSYIDKLKINIKTDIIDTLLFLKNKKCIDIQGENITILNEDMTDSEKYIVDNFKYFKGNELIFERNLLNIVMQEAFNMDYIEYRRMNFVEFIYFSLPLLSVILIGLCFPIIYFAAFFAIFIFTTSYAVKLKNTLESNIIMDRTKRGQTLNENIQGLKRYINEFSLLKEKNADAIVLWEDYLVYSVIFGINEEIVEEYSKRWYN